MGQPSGKFDYKMFYSKPPSFDIPIKSIIPGGWGDEFEDDEPVNKEDKRSENSEQSQKEVKDLLGQPLSEIDHKAFYSKSFPGDIPLKEIMPIDSFELPGRKETCMVEV